MTSLYYIAPKKQLDRFDDLFDRAEILPTAFPAESIRSLTAFIKNERAIAQQNYIVIDVGDLTRWSSGHVLSAVQYLRSFATIRLIFIGQPCEAVEDLFRCLRDTHHIDDVILAAADASNVSIALAEMLSLSQPGGAQRPAEVRTLSPQEKMSAAQQTSLHYQAQPALRKYAVAPGTTLKIDVAGTMPRCGTTTQSLQLYHFLTAAGLYGAILDRAGTLPVLSQFEAVTETKHGGRSIRGICFIEPDASTNAYDFVVTDWGVLTPEKVSSLCAADISVLVGCTKPWELPAMAEAVKLLFGHSHQYMVTIASFSADSDLQKLGRYLGEHYAAAPYQPDIWRLAGYDVYQRLISPALDRCCIGQVLEGPEYGS